MPVFPASGFSVFISEGALANQAVVAATAFDADAGNNSRLSYEIVDGNNGGITTIIFIIIINHHYNHKNQHFHHKNQHCHHNHQHYHHNHHSFHHSQHCFAILDFLASYEKIMLIQVYFLGDFKISAEKGVVMTARKLERQITFMYNLTIQASDSGSPSMASKVNFFS